jgi:branched-chain amino acid transport system permease protein
MNSHVLGAAVLFGFTEGCILFLVSIGLSLCFGLMRIISLDQCGYYALGAYITYTFTLLTGSYWFGLLIAMIVIAFIGFIIEHVIYKNVYAKPLTYTMIISFGALLLITGLTKYIWGLNPIPVAQPISGTFYIFGLEVPIYRLFIVIVTFLIYIFIYFFLNKTIIGKAIRASIEDVEKVEALGINAYNLFTIYMFITAVLGGLGSVKGTMIAAIIIGETISIGSVVWPPSTIILPFIAFIIVLLIKPTGLFGSKLLKR